MWAPLLNTVLFKESTYQVPPTLRKPREVIKSPLWDPTWGAIWPSEGLSEGGGPRVGAIFPKMRQNRVLACEGNFYPFPIDF